MTRGDIHRTTGLPGGDRPCVIVTRPTVIPYLRSVTVALITRTVRGLPTEVAVGPENGLAEESVINCDNLATIPKDNLGPRRGELNPAQTGDLDQALRIALALD